MLLSYEKNCEDHIIKMEEKENLNKKKYYGIFIAGFLWGITFTFVFGVIILRHSLVYEDQSLLGYEETVMTLKKNAETLPGWFVRFGSACSLPKIQDGSQITVMEFCNGKYSSLLLNNEETRKISAIIPCTFAVYRKSDGKTYISRLNLSFMASMLGRKATRIFNGKINPEQKKILQGVVK